MKMPLAILLMMTSLFPAQKKANSFQLFLFEHDVTEAYHLHFYEYDTTWTHFLHNVNLKHAAYVIHLEDIERYDWDNQELTLLESGQEKLDQYDEIDQMLDQAPFIVVVDGRRAYAGTFTPHVSAAAINHPVIHYGYSKNKIRIYPIHTIWEYADLPSEIKAMTALEEIRIFFSNADKLK